ncbi:hypothetical protein [Nonomuraea bangladeshensis]|uniref:hypothetical protein n=1 Tax=Nonomuraea bangladeshensis TaxID=404385 RepID=UPI003C2DD9A3
MSTNPDTVYQLDAKTFISGYVTAPTRREARAKFRAVIEALALASGDPTVVLDGLSIDGDIDIYDETPAPAPAAEPGAAGPHLGDGLPRP